MSPVGSPEEAHLDLIAQFSTGRVNGDRPREVAHVQSVIAVPIPAVRTLADLDVILAVGRSENRRGRVLLQQWRIVSRNQLEPLGIEDGDVRIKHRDAEPHSLDLGTDPLPLFCVDHKVVDILGVDHTVNGDVHRDRLRSRELGVGLLLLDLAKRPDVKRPVFGHAAGRADMGHVFAQPTVSRHLDRRLDGAGARLELGHVKAGRKEENLLRVSQLAPVEGQHTLCPPLQTAGQDQIERRGCGPRRVRSRREKPQGKGKN